MKLMCCAEVFSLVLLLASLDDWGAGRGRGVMHNRWVVSGASLAVGRHMGVESTFHKLDDQRLCIGVENGCYVFVVLSTHISSGVVCLYAVSDLRTDASGKGFSG